MQEAKALRLALALREADVAATRESFEFTLRALAMALGGCGQLRGQLVLALESSVRQFRGEHLSLPAQQTLSEEHQKFANAAYREAIAASMEQLVGTIRSVGT